MDYDEPEQEVDRTYTTEDVVFIENRIATNGYIFLQLIAADESDEAQFFFYSEEVDEDITIPVGTYTIDYTEEYGTVQANPGVQGNGVWPSFYAEKAEGGFAVPLWLLVGGTVEVRKDEQLNAHLEVNAYNSYDLYISFLTAHLQPFPILDTQYLIPERFSRMGNFISFVREICII